MPPKTIWIVDAAYLFSAAPGKVDYLKLKAALEQLNGVAFYESYYLNSAQESPSEAEQRFQTWLKLAPPPGPPDARATLYIEAPPRAVSAVRHRL